MEINNILQIKNHQIITLKNILDNLQKRKKKLLSLGSGLNKLDEFLGGGFKQGMQYLIFGANRTGKTQLAHQLCLQAFINFSEKYERIRNKNVKSVYYFDIENTFRPERLRELALKSGYENKEVLESILVSKIMSNSAFLLSLKDLENGIEKGKVGVLIIDSINNHYNSEMANKRDSFTAVKVKFLKILMEINRLTQKYNLITVVFSQVTSNLSKDAVISVLPIGNQYLNHYFSEYIFLEQKDEYRWCVQLVNSLNFPEKKMTYKITSSGVIS